MKDDRIFANVNRELARQGITDIKAVYYLGGFTYTEENQQQLALALENNQVEELLNNLTFDVRYDDITQLYRIQDGQDENWLAAILDPFELYYNNELLWVRRVGDLSLPEGKLDNEYIKSISDSKLDLSTKRFYQALVSLICLGLALVFIVFLSLCGNKQERLAVDRACFTDYLTNTLWLHHITNECIDTLVFNKEGTSYSYGCECELRSCGHYLVSNDTVYITKVIDTSYRFTPCDIDDNDLEGRYALVLDSCNLVHIKRWYRDINKNWQLDDQPLPSRLIYTPQTKNATLSDGVSIE